MYYSIHFQSTFLTDRKAILSGGRLRCAGSSLFLKTRYGLGYSLSYDKFELRLMADCAFNIGRKSTKNMLHMHDQKIKQF